jgi:hypothetical protein
MKNQSGKLRAKKTAVDLTEQLAGLIKAGWSEHDVARLARMRGSYARLKDETIITAGNENSSPPSHLAFVRWLYQNNRLFS